MTALDDHASAMAGIDVRSCLSHRYVAHKANNIWCLKFIYGLTPE